jgi:hypothetical protein
MNMGRTKEARSPGQPPLGAPTRRPDALAAKATSQIEPSIASVYANAWRTLKGDFWTLSAIGFVFCLLGLAIGIALLNRSPALGSLYMLSIGWPISFGALHASLRAVRGDRPDVGDLLVPFRRFYIYSLLAGLLVAAAVAVGFGLLVVPGIILAVRLSFMPFLVIDERRGPVDALFVSWKRTSGYGWTILWTVAAGVVIMYVGLFIFIVGAIPAAMLFYLAFASLYEAISSRKGVLAVPTAAESAQRTSPTRFPTAASSDPPIPPAEGPATAKARRRPIQYSYRSTSTPVTSVPPTNETEMASSGAAPAPTGAPAPTSLASTGNTQDVIPVAVIEVPRLQVPQLGDNGCELRDPHTGKAVLGPWVFRVRGLHQDELDDADRRSLVKRVDRRTGRNHWVADASARASWIIYLATVPEDREKPGGWDDRSMWARFGASNGVEVIDRLLRPGEKNTVLSGISQLSGINVG